MTPPDVEARTQVVLATSARTPGGLWRHVMDLAGGLRSLGWGVSVALPADADALYAESSAAGFAVVDLGELLRHRPAVRPRPVLHVHLADTFDRAALGLLVRARLRGYRVVVTEHLPRTNASDSRLAGGSSNRLAHFAKSVFKAIQFAFAHRVVAVSDASRHFIRTRYHLRADKIVTVPNGIEALREPGSAAPDGPVSFVVAGSLIQQKGVDVLVAASKLAKRDWTVDVYGDGPHRVALEEQSSAGGDRGAARVRFLGWSSHVQDALRNSDALVLPSRWESAPYVVLEAMAQARAVIGTRVDGVTEMVDGAAPGSGTCGVLVQPDDAADLARVLDEMALDKVGLKSMGSAGRLRVERCYSLTEMVRRTESVYRSTEISR